MLTWTKLRRGATVSADPPDHPVSCAWSLSDIFSTSSGTWFFETCFLPWQWGSVLVASVPWPRHHCHHRQPPWPLPALPGPPPPLALPEERIGVSGQSVTSSTVFQYKKSVWFRFHEQISWMSVCVMICLSICLSVFTALLLTCPPGSSVPVRSCLYAC